MSNKTYPDVAFGLMKKRKKPIAFAQLCELVQKELNITDAEIKSRIVKFYNALSLDSRFVQLEKNTWDLRERQTYEKTRLNIETVDLNEDEIEIEEVNDESFELYETLTQSDF